MAELWFIAGEESADEFSSKIALLCRRNNNSLKIAAMGGRHLKEAGVEILIDSTELGVMGFFEVAKKIVSFSRILKKLVFLARVRQPDVVVLVDFPGFNLRLAKKLHSLGVRVFYFIIPKVWIRGASRIQVLDKYVAKVFVIFAFEKELFVGCKNIEVEYVGHPLASLHKERENLPVKQKNLIALLPGSRTNEVSLLIEPIIATAKKLKQKHPEWEFILPVSRASLKKIAEEKIAGQASDIGIEVVCGKTIESLYKAQVALACSGTVTLQALLAGTAVVNIYKMNPLTYWYALFLMRKAKYFTLGNIILQREAFEEFFQSQVESTRLSLALERVMPGGESYAHACESIKQVKKALYDGGDCFEKVAKFIREELGQ